MLATRRFVFGAALCACVPPQLALAQTAGAKFVCPPCGCSYDGKEFDKPGVCPDPACGMTLIPKPVSAPPASATPPKAPAPAP